MNQLLSEYSENVNGVKTNLDSLFSSTTSTLEKLYLETLDIHQLMQCITEEKLSQTSCSLFIRYLLTRYLSINLQTVENLIQNGVQDDEEMMVLKKITSGIPDVMIIIKKIVILVETLPLSSSLLTALSECIQNTSNPLLRQKITFFFYKYIESKTNTPGFTIPSPLFSQLQSMLIESCTDVWSANRKNGAFLFQKLFLRLSRHQQLELCEGFMKLLHDENKCWKTQEGALLAMNSILLTNQTNFNFTLAFKKIIFGSIKSPQLSVREIASLCMHSYLQLHDQNTRCMLFQEVIGKLHQIVKSAKKDPHRNTFKLKEKEAENFRNLLINNSSKEKEDEKPTRNLTDQLVHNSTTKKVEKLEEQFKETTMKISTGSTFETEGLLQLCNVIFSLIEVPFLRKHWKYISQVLMASLGHEASSVRQIASTAVEKAVVFVLFSNSDQASEEIINTNISLLLELLDVLSLDNPISWEKKEGIMLALDLILSYLGKGLLRSIHDDLCPSEDQVANEISNKHLYFRSFTEIFSHYQRYHQNWKRVAESTWLSESNEMTTRSIPSPTDRMEKQKFFLKKYHELIEKHPKYNFQQLLKKILQQSTQALSHSIFEIRRMGSQLLSTVLRVISLVNLDIYTEWFGIQHKPDVIVPTLTSLCLHIRFLTEKLYLNETIISQHLVKLKQKLSKLNFQVLQDAFLKKEGLNKDEPECLIKETMDFNNKEYESSFKNKVYESFLKNTTLHKKYIEAILMLTIVLENQPFLYSSISLDKVVQTLVKFVVKHQISRYLPTDHSFMMQVVLGWLRNDNHKKCLLRTPQENQSLLIEAVLVIWTNYDSKVIYHEELFDETIETLHHLLNQHLISNKRLIETICDAFIILYDKSSKRKKLPGTLHILSSKVKEEENNRLNLVDMDQSEESDWDVNDEEIVNDSSFSMGCGRFISVFVSQGKDYGEISNGRQLLEYLELDDENIRVLSSEGEILLRVCMPSFGASRYYLQVKKGGQIVDKLAIGKKSFYVFGRNSHVSDFVLDHPSVSRMHALIGHDKRGQLLLMDLASGHGTFHNGVEIKANDSVVLKDHDIVGFGASTREYIVCLSKEDTNDSFKETCSDDLGVCAREELPTSFASTEDIEVKKRQEREKRQKEIAQMTADFLNSTSSKDSVKSSTPLEGSLNLATEPSNVAKESKPKEFLPKVQSEGDVNEEPYEEISQSIIDQYSLPISHEISLLGHSKPVTAIAVDAVGARFATGGMDFEVRVWDFAGMARNVKSFRQVEVEEGNCINALSYSPTGDRFIACTGSAQPKIISREGVEVMQFCKGDMYVMDMANTNGHTHGVTGGMWHPVDKENALTSSLDGTIRIWNLYGKRTFDKLINDKVIKARSKRGSRIGVTACSYNNDVSCIYGATIDGQLQCWDIRHRYFTPNQTVKEAHVDGSTISCIVMSPNGTTMATRSDDSTIKLWDTRKWKSPVKVFEDIDSHFSTSNCAFNESGAVLIAGTSVRRGVEGTGMLKAYNAISNQVDPIYKVAVASETSVVSVAWHYSINQIFVGLSDGSGRVYYDPRMSSKGAMLTATMKMRPKSALDFAANIGDIGTTRTPHSLPMFREDDENFKRPRERARIDPRKARVPERPITGPGVGGRISSNCTNFTQFYMQSHIKTSFREQDPREAILNYAKDAEQNPDLIGSAYAQTQPSDRIAKKYRLAEKTLEEENKEKEEEHKKIL